MSANRIPVLRLDQMVQKSRMLRVIRSMAGPDGATADADLVDSIVTELQASIREMRCASTERLVRGDLSTANVHVLWLLEHHGAVPMSRLAEYLDVSLSN